ncbi:MAG TPA: dTDP-4-dehydrorhamnose reductase [Candidatus Angelobacter sp.]|nr:dTDP-4-dehydrorhamnose reductase [Candidatus Angelobacter sp.]
MRIVLVGGKGQVGSDLVQFLKDQQEDYVSLGRSDLDVTARAVLRTRLSQHNPEVIINCSVFHPVDECESDPERSFAVNAIAVRDLGLVAKDFGASVVHFSSDYVFDGELGRPYREEDTPNPRSVFGVTKVAGEQLLRAVLPNHFIIRTSGLYGLAGSRVKRGNFVETMLRLGRQKGEVRVVNDLRMAQTSTRNLAKQVLALIRTKNYGTYHASDHGDYSWYEFAKKIFEYAGMRVTVTPVSWRDMPALVPRPRYSVLENHRLKALGLDQMQDIDVALQAYLKARDRIPLSESAFA